MKTLRVSLGLLLATTLSFAQEPVAPPAAPSVAVKRTASELEQLVGPIALYPDALIALILPASTVPTDIVLAARHLQDFPNDRSQIEHRAWDESVKSLAHYPEVVKWMDENLDWTKQLGEAFTDQPAEVMQAVQRLRAKARAAGTLVDTPQQQVIAEPEVIRIVPAQPDVIYVPHYVPEVVFVDRPIYHPQPFLTFGVGMSVGSWLAFDCDWRRHSIWVGNRHRHWHRHDWRQPMVPIGPVGHGTVRRTEVRQWRPPVQPPRPPTTLAYHRPVEVVRPSPFGSGRSHYDGRRGSSSSHGGNSHYRRPELANTPAAVNGSPAVNPLPRTFAAGPNAEVAGPRGGANPTPQPALQALPTARGHNPVVAPPALAQPAPGTARAEHGNSANGAQWRQNREARGGGQASAAPTPTTTRPLPMAASSQPVQVTGPASATPPQHHRSAAPPPQVRTYSRPAPAANAPTLPMATSTRPAPSGPTASAPAPAAAPVAAAPAPAQAAPPAARNGDERRGGRQNPNQHEH